MTIYDSAHDLRIVIRSANAVVVDDRAALIEAEDHLGLFYLDHTSAPTMAALVPGTIVLHRRDGSQQRVQVNFGSLTSVGNQVRIAASEAYVVDEMPIAV